MRSKPFRSWPLVDVRAVFSAYGKPETRALHVRAWRKVRYRGEIRGEVATWDGWLMTDPDTIRRAVAAGLPREADENYTPTARDLARSATNYAEGL